MKGRWKQQSWGWKTDLGESYKEEEAGIRAEP